MWDDTVADAPGLDGGLASSLYAVMPDQWAAVVMSWEVGVAKPHEAAFRAALERLGVTAAQTLMVGDSWQDDAAAAALGIRTLILPRTPPPVHGLALVLQMVG